MLSCHHKEWKSTTFRNWKIHQKSEIGEDFQRCDMPLVEEKESLLFRWLYLFKMNARITMRINECSTMKIITTAKTYNMNEEQPVMNLGESLDLLHCAGRLQDFI